MPSITFDISQGQVVCWLDTLPFDSTVFPCPDSFQRNLKRQRSSNLDNSRKRHRPISPPKSGAKHSKSSSTVSGPSKSQVMQPSTPSKSPVKRIATAHDAPDNDETPRASTTSGKDLRSNAPDFHSESQSETSSRASKRSKRSQSPTKNFPLYGPEGRRLTRGSLNSMINQGASSARLRDLIREMKRVFLQHEIMPRKCKSQIEKLPEVEYSVEPLLDYMFYDDGTIEGEELTYRARAEELVRRASRIAERSGDCASMLSDEAAWNNLVHTPLLEMLISEMGDIPGYDILDFMPCTTTNIDSTYHRFAESSSCVDYIFRIRPKRDPTVNIENMLIAQPQQPPHQTLQIQQAAQYTAPCFNWTSDKVLQQYPLGISIETKRHGGDIAKGEQQLAIWHAAQWEFLIARSGDAVSQLGFLPGIVVQGHSWSLVVTTRSQTTTTVLPSIEFGRTDSTIGVFQVIAGLQKLRAWTLEILWPWYKRNLPEFKNSAVSSLP